MICRKIVRPSLAAIAFLTMLSIEATGQGVDMPKKQQREAKAGTAQVRSTPAPSASTPVKAADADADQANPERDASKLLLNVENQRIGGDPDADHVRAREAYFRMGRTVMPVGSGFHPSRLGAKTTADGHTAIGRCFESHCTA